MKCTINNNNKYNARKRVIEAKITVRMRNFSLTSFLSLIILRSVNIFLMKKDKIEMKKIKVADTNYLAIPYNICNGEDECYDNH
nr:5216_t:CDS:2 [Entrophospora candida]